MTTQRSLARCQDFDFGIDDHGMPVLWGSFEYEDGGEQGFGCQVDVAFLMRFVLAVGVERLSEVNGKSCWVLHTALEILLVEPLHKKDGVPFDLNKWREWCARRGSKASAYEMRTGTEL